MTRWVAYGLLAILASLPSFSRAESSAHIELQRRSATPDKAKVSEKELNALYSNYVECLNTVSSDETCYQRWSIECEALFGGECPLEETMFPSSSAGDESC